MSGGAKPRGRRLLRALAVTVAAVACGEIGYEPVVLDVTGQWNGALILDGMPARSVAMTLHQTAATVMGAASIEGALTDAPLDGTLSTTGLLRWGSHDEDCGLWSGQLFISEDHAMLSGSVQLNETHCEGSFVMGTASLERAEP
jgi:hypothetical protein